LQRIAADEHVYLHGFDNSVMGEGHWNEAGHRNAATIIANGLCTSALAYVH
jgi:hypothetical protein